MNYRSTRNYADSGQLDGLRSTKQTSVTEMSYSSTHGLRSTRPAVKLDGSV